MEITKPKCNNCRSYSITPQKPNGELLCDDCWSMNINTKTLKKMNKLREKFENLDEYDEGGVIYCHNEEQCEQITDDFSVKLLDWLEVSGYRFNEDVKMFKNTDGRLKTTTELLQIFKTQYYGKE